MHRRCVQPRLAVCVFLVIVCPAPACGLQDHLKYLVCVCPSQQIAALCTLLCAGHLDEHLHIWLELLSESPASNIV